MLLRRTPMQNRDVLSPSSMSEGACHDPELGNVLKNVGAKEGPQESKRGPKERDHMESKIRVETGMEAHWVALAKEFRDADEDLIKSVDDSINSLLLFAGLFSAVQSAFAVVTYPLLQPYPPKALDITINVFVFSSLALALTCAFVGILRKDQLKQHLSWMSNLKRKDARARLVDRQFNFEMNTNRLLWDSANQLSVGLTLSISLFAVRIFLLLWTMSKLVALVVLLFVCFALCLIFWRDIPFYYLRLRAWVRAVQRKVYLILPVFWNRLKTLFEIEPAQVESGLRPSESEADTGRLLWRAIISRASGLTASGIVDPDFWQHRVRGLSGLCKFSVSSEKAEAQIVMLRRIVNLVVGIVEDRDLLTGSADLCSPWWSRIKRYLMTEKAISQRRARPSGWSQVTSAAASVHSWLEWIRDALPEFNTEEICLLSDVISDQLAHTLRLTKPTPRSISGVLGSPEEPLFSAFCLARVIIEKLPPGPSELKLRQAVALAGVRLFANLPSVSDLSFAAHVDQDAREHETGPLLAWANPWASKSSYSEALTLPAHLRALFQDDVRNLWQIDDDEFAADAFLGAALNIDLAPLLSLQRYDWADSAECCLFLMTSSYALARLKNIQRTDRAIVTTRHPMITKLGLRLTDVLRLDLLTSLPDREQEQLFPHDMVAKTMTEMVAASASVPEATRGFPFFGYRAMEDFVGCFPAEMGAILRFLAKSERRTSVRHLELLPAAALFPPDNAADDALGAIITHHLAKRDDTARRSEASGTKLRSNYNALGDAESDVHESSNAGPSQVLAGTAESSVSPRVSLPRHTPGLHVGNSVDVHARDLNREPSPDHPIGVLPAGSAAGASDSDPASRTATELAGDAHTRTISHSVDQPSPHVAIDMQPVPPEPLTLSGVDFLNTGLNLEGHRSVPPEHTTFSPSVSGSGTDRAYGRAHGSNGFTGGAQDGQPGGDEGHRLNQGEHRHIAE